MVSASKQPDPAGGQFPPGQVSAPSQASVHGSPLPERATTPGPCPTCGHHGPRIVLCYDPVCLHSLYGHDIRKDGSRGACTFTTASGRCPCKQAIPNNPEDPENPS